MIETNQGKLKMKIAFVYQTKFTNDRKNYLDVVVAESAIDADLEATQIVRSISDEHGCDEWAEVVIIGPLTSDYATFIEELSK